MPDPVRTDEKKCAHQTCTCMVAGGRRFCSDYCEDSNDSDPTSVCTCDHPGCKSNRYGRSEPKKHGDAATGIKTARAASPRLGVRGG